MTNPSISVVLPVYGQADVIGGVVEQFEAALAHIDDQHEIILVPNDRSPSTEAACADLATAFSSVRSVPIKQSGWGRAVRAGLAEARGDLLCYTNSARTSAEDLVLLLLYARVYPHVVVKANRKIRDNWRRRLGSLVYNLEVRALFDLSYWDINGTPKVFPRSFDRLLHLTRNDDLIDAEFNVLCRREAYPVVEVPIFSNRRAGGTSTTNYSSALRMYVGAYQLFQQYREAGQ